MFCSLLSCFGNVLTDRGWNCGQLKIFRRRVFSENNGRPRNFQRVICFSQFPARELSKSSEKVLPAAGAINWTKIHDAHYIALWGSWEHFKLRSVVHWLTGQGTLRCRIFFPIVSPSAQFYYYSHHVEKWPNRVSAFIAQRFMSAHVTSGLRQNLL